MNEHTQLHAVVSSSGRAPCVGRVVARPRLDATLGTLVAGSSHLMTIWSAAGSGKTTLLGQWARLLTDGGFSVVMISGESLERVPDILSGLAASDRDRPGQTDASRSIVMVDDIHLLAGRAAKAAVTALLNVLPSVAGVIIAGRYQPVGTHAPLNTAGGLAVLRTADLAFTRVELNALTECHSVCLDDVVLDVLLRRTEGWAIAVALAVPWLKESADARAAVLGFDGDHRAVADYLVSEVLESLSVDERFVLATTAIRSDVPLELASYVSGLPNAGELLHEICQRNSLMIEDSEGYHYHPVLLSFLQADARRKNVHDFAAAHTKAFTWFYAREDGAHALEEALASGRGHNIQSALDRFGLELMLAGETDLIDRAMAALPTSAAPLALVATQLLFEAPFFADSTRATHLFEEALAHDTAGTPTQEPWLAVALALHCLVGTTHHSYEARLRRLRSADIVALRRKSLALDLLAEVAEAWCIGRVGAPADALLRLREVGISADRAGFGWLSLMAASCAAPLATLSGRWELAAAIEDQVIVQLSAHPRTQPGRVRSSATIISAVRSYRRCEAMQTEELDALIAADAHRLTPGARVPAIAARTGARLDSEANPRPALETMDRLMRDHGVHYPQLFAVVALRLVSLHLTLDGRAEAQERAADVYALLGDDSVESETVRLALALPTRRGDAAEESLLAALHNTARSWHAGAPIGAWILLAHAAELRGSHSEADIRLTHAVRLAQRFDVLQPFAARGGEGATLLTVRSGRFGPLDSFAAQVQAAVHSLLPAQPEQSSPGVPLTQREHDILNELPVHQSVAEIARKQTLSVNTVKTHMRSIYQKLGVTDRSDAVSTAQILGLL